MIEHKIQHRVVIVGGGFGGLQAARHLGRADVDLTIVDRRNFHLFQPLAYQVATGALSAAEICYPLRSIFHGQPNVHVILGEVVGFDLDGRELDLRTPAGDQRLGYDTLIVAGGSTYNYFDHPEWQRTASELKSLEGALDIRSRILLALETAEVETDEAKRAALLTFAVVGGGPTGVEMAGQIAEIARDTRKDFRVADTSKALVLLIEAGPRVLARLPTPAFGQGGAVPGTPRRHAAPAPPGHRPRRGGPGSAERRARATDRGPYHHLGGGRACLRDRRLTLPGRQALRSIARAGSSSSPTYRFRDTPT